MAAKNNKQSHILSLLHTELMNEKLIYIIMTFHEAYHFVHEPLLRQNQHVNI